MNNTDNKDQKERKKFNLSLFRFIKLNTEGYTAEENQKILVTITSPKRLFPFMIFLLVLLVFSASQGKDILDILKTYFYPP